MFAAVVAHLVLAAALPALTGRLGRTAFLLAAAAPAATFGWLVVRIPAVLDAATAAPSALATPAAAGVAATTATTAAVGGHGAPAGDLLVETLTWAPTVELEIVFRLAPLALLMALLVTGVGAAVLVYSFAYHAPHAADGGVPVPGSAGPGRASAALLAFAGAMLGLVLADDLFTLYLFWELTTVFSFLLIGQDGVSAPGRRSAVQALLITSVGGLAMLFGFVLLGQAAGTYRISRIVAAPPSGAVVTAALVLVLLGALTKSAQIPFHSWLPAAMVAPTPVSAYLHAAAMVKAGVFLVATLTPAFAGVVGWQVPAVALGAATMLLGGLRALVQTDLKRLLAFGTVSQLGFLTALVGFGSRTAALAGATLILAHGLFKAALFMVVGIVDHQAGTRDLRDLSGLWRSVPVVCGGAVLAAASMVGLPPFLGYLGKEAAFEALVHGGAGELALLAVFVVGSCLTTGYALRFLWGAFGSWPGAPPSAVARPAAVFVAPVVVLALAGLGLGIAHRGVDRLVAAYADAFPAGAARYHLALWHGPGWPIALSAVAVAGGVLVFAVAARATAPMTPATAMPGRPRWLSPRLPDLLDAQRGYERAVRALDWSAVAVTGRLQTGSLPAYLGVILLTVLAVPGTALVTGASWPDDLPWWDYRIQLPLAVGILLASLAVVRARSRLTATLLLGAVGYGIGALFVVDGAPDLALAQFLVETLSLIVFVFVLRRMPVRFSTADRSSPLRLPRIAVAVAVGVFVAGFAIVTSGSRAGMAQPSREFIARSPGETGATNVVNAILVDFRAFDTLGEIAVLAVAALGVASLLLLVRTPQGRTIDQLLGPADRRAEEPVRARSVLLEVTTRAVFPVVLVFSLYLLFAGHTRTGGGFSGGLVAGLAFVLRYVAGRRRRVGAAVPVVPTAVIGTGLVTAAAAGLAPALLGDPVLESYVFKGDLPVLGHVELVTSLFFDVGVYLLIIGVVLELLRTLGTAVDKEADAEIEAGRERVDEIA
ncbi:MULTISPECIES: Na+/H+ antiporter subunit A [unclassified Parafrankia]|uniref:Na+/H+ antiporter subunit A n=1 Tax=unclassified Parafrankia TaxID=2994368 RepID=UPI000DA492F9|nr:MULTISPECIES: Na+/H+ antiporter subunit A [unclassified Parafrankia]TCJ36135.1 Na+/H+ antiporter subunit A [Parafrankia sp. BMG5.11]SQD96675.1 NADH dehydrogenase (Quinone) [Parafrankia sp. Ea1.12]